MFMTDFIENRPDWLIAAQEPGTSLETLTVESKAYLYTLVRSDLNPALPYTVGFPHPEALFISSDVNSEYRELILGHEIRERTVMFHLPEEERCISSLQIELTEALNKLGVTEYICYMRSRRAFFRALVNNYQTT